MKIYTKKGDEGLTSLYGGVKLAKDELRLWAYGTLDEMNSSLGVALADDSVSTDLRKRLSRIQNELFQLGAELAVPHGKKPTSKLINAHDIEELEKEIDEMESKLSPLKTFILPGGSRVASHLHLARTVCRRAERETVTLNRAEPLRAEVLQYINRLSDYFFVCARFANLELKVADVPWIS